jgi:hypothetical protein
MRNVSSLAAAALMFAAGAPAHGQYMPHLDPNLYIMIGLMNGGSQCLNMPEKELAEARDPAPGVMKRYFAAAGGGGAKSAAFKLNSKTKWTSGATVAGVADLDKAADPLAAVGNSLEPEPLRFYRAGNFSSALGQWAVRDASGGIAGMYTAMFEREKGEWKLRELTVSKADDVVEPVAPYCAKPGDTTQQRVTSAAEFVTWNEKQLAKRRTKLAAAEATAATAKGAAAKEAAAMLEREKKKLVQAEEALAKARENHAEAVAAAEEIKRLTLPAREAEQMRKKAEAKKEEAKAG